MAKKKVKRTRAVTRKSPKASSGLHQLFHKKHRPLHAAGIGVLLVLLKGIAAVFATIGVAILLISAFAFLWKAARANHS